MGSTMILQYCILQDELNWNFKVCYCFIALHQVPALRPGWLSWRFQQCVFLVLRLKHVFMCIHLEHIFNSIIVAINNCKIGLFDHRVEDRTHVVAFLKSEVWAVLSWLVTNYCLKFRRWKSLQRVIYWAFIRTFCTISKSHVLSLIRFLFGIPRSMCTVCWLFEI